MPLLKHTATPHACHHRPFKIHSSWRAWLTGWLVRPFHSCSDPNQSSFQPYSFVCSSTHAHAAILRKRMLSLFPVASSRLSHSSSLALQARECSIEIVARFVASRLHTVHNSCTMLGAGCWWRWFWFTSGTSRKHVQIPSVRFFYNYKAIMHRNGIGKKWNKTEMGCSITVPLVSLSLFIGFV